MKRLWIEIGIVCVVMLVMVIATPYDLGEEVWSYIPGIIDEALPEMTHVPYLFQRAISDGDNSGEAARSHLLSIIDEALLDATEDSPDYLDADNGIRFQNSITLQTLRDAIEEGAMLNQTNFVPSSPLIHPLIWAGEQKIGTDDRLLCEYDGEWWEVELIPTYLRLFQGYIHHIRVVHECFGVFLKKPFEYGQYFDENVHGHQIGESFMEIGSSVTSYTVRDRGEEILLFANVFSHVTVHKPDGSIGMHFEYPGITVDGPLVIPVDEAGRWAVNVTRIADEKAGEKANPGGPFSRDTEPLQYSPIQIGSRSAAVELDLPEVTNDPYLLRRLVEEQPGTIVVTENGKTLSMSQPLANGRHDLSFERVMADGRVSKVTHYSLIIDTLAPDSVARKERTPHDPGEEARSYLLGIIDKELRTATKDVHDYIESNESKLYLKNSVSLERLRNAVKNAEMADSNISFSGSSGLIFPVGEQELRYTGNFSFEYEGRWWKAQVDDALLQDYIRLIEEKGKIYGMPSGGIPYDFDSSLDENTQKIVQESRYMGRGDSMTLYAELDGSEDLLVFGNVLGMRDVIVRKPDGSVAVHLKDDSHYFRWPTVSVDKAGTWSVTVTRQTEEEAYADVDLSKLAPQAWYHFSTLMLASRPAAVEIDLPKVTDDPYLFSRVVAELPGTVVVTENEEPISLSQPLADGKHRLDFQRVMPDGRVSEVTARTLRVEVDTLMPEITLGDFERETNLPNVQLNVSLSDNVKDFYINKRWYGIGTGNRNDLLESMRLEVGENVFELRAVSFAGQEARCTVTVTRIDSERDQT